MIDIQVIYDRTEEAMRQVAELLSLTDDYSSYDGTTGEIVSSADEDISYAVFKLLSALRKLGKTL